jgi:hypothetical protein
MNVIVHSVSLSLSEAEAVPLHAMENKTPFQIINLIIV